MKYLFQLVLFFLVFGSISAQPLLKNVNTPTGSGNTFAVIIGISNYLDTDIKALQYSNRDAQVFADFLMSASGGSVPKKHIKLLLDTSATTGEVDNAVLWLKNNCQAGDKVFFYFSGHGVLENETMHRDGYLVCYNTPSNAFVRMGLSIDWLNKMANTMSEKKANVVIITDACHSGRVANSNVRGNILVGEQLLNASEKEIRMASCKPDQLSIEKADWGGGRGVFSYHLINGLQGGLADKDQDGSVTSGEIKNYVEFKMANDSVLKRDNEVQTPVIKGRTDFPLSKVVEPDAAQIKKMVAEDSMANVQLSASLAKAKSEEIDDPVHAFFEIIKNENLAETFEKVPLQNIPDEYLTEFIINNFLFYVREEDDLREMRESDFEQKFAPRRAIQDKLSALLKNDPQILERFNIELSRALNDKGQEMILKYLKGDEAELDQRMYYNPVNKGYDVYANMLEAARRLSITDQYLSTTSAILKHYFTGVSHRLKTRQIKNTDSLINLAFEELNKALALEEHAAYIYNELGILYEYKKNFAEAEKNYIKATQFSPQWALPYANLCGLYAAKGAFNKSQVACNTADSLQPGLFPVKINKGYLNEVKGNNLLADEIYHEAIGINSRHFAAFERLGYVHMTSMDYSKADSFFYEAAERKKNYHFNGNVWDPWDVRASGPGSNPDPECDFEWAKLNPLDILGHFAQAVQKYRQFETDVAKGLLEKVILLDESNPLAYHFLGKIYYDAQQWEMADLMFKRARQNYRDTGGVTQYIDSVRKAVNYGYDLTCFTDFFLSCQYDRSADYFFAGTLHESWKHFKEAEQYFKAGIRANPNEIGGYAKLWHLYEKQGRYQETEVVIKKIAGIDKEQSDRELNAFYRCVIEKFPEDAWWNYKLGLLMYDRASERSHVRYLDSIVYFPLIKEELFIDQEYFDRLKTDPIFAISNNARPEEYDKFRLDISKMTFKFPAYYEVPGTKEAIGTADKILLPRKEGITYLSKAAELIADKGLLADINYKIGNIYQWAGSKKMAYPYFEKSLALNPDDADVRATLIDIYDNLHKNTAALEQLNYLHDSSQINSAKRLLLARYYIMAGQFKKADSLLIQAEALAPGNTTEILPLKSQLIFLSKKPADAIQYYKTQVKQNADDSFAFYNLARLHAKTGKTADAFIYLESAIKHGFNYSYVFQHDGYMDSLRKMPDWQSLIKGVNFKKYNQETPGN